jgi:hypothetical protein
VSVNSLTEFLKPFLKIRLSQFKTIIALCAGLIRGGQIGVSAIGRSMEGPAFEKHRIKRVDRFLGNKHFEREKFAKAFVRKLTEPYNDIFISIDWTDGEDGVHTILEASLATRSRGIPIWWKVVRKDELECQQNLYEERFVEELLGLLPEGKEVVILADRGFHRVSFLKKLAHLGFGFIVRLPITTWLDSLKFRGILGDLVLRRGDFKNYGWSYLHKKERFRIRVVACFDEAQKEPWILATTLRSRLKSVFQAYGRRFEIEEMNKDIKNERTGLRLRGLKISCPERLERLLSVVSLAYAVMFLAGMYGERKRIHRRLMANTKKSRTLALWRVGRYVLNEMKLALEKLIPLFPRLLFTG